MGLPYFSSFQAVVAQEASNRPHETFPALFWPPPHRTVCPPTLGSSWIHPMDRSPGGTDTAEVGMATLAGVGILLQLFFPPAPGPGEPEERGQLLL